MSPVQIWPSAPLARQGSAQAVIDAVGPVRHGDRKHQLYDLLLIQVLTDRVDVDVLDVPREAGQKVGEAQNGSLGCVEEILVSSLAGFTQRRDLFVRATSPLRRSGV